MKFEKDVKIQELGKHQALNGDYENSGFDKGHLAPVYQAQSQKCADATFTLTNAAPQNPSFNRGVVPGNGKIKNRVNVPSHFCTAYCCLDNNNKCKISSGFIGKNENIRPKEENLDKNKTSPNMTPENEVKVQQLGDHQALNGDYENSGFDKGHLAPVYQAQSQKCADATFTLTNAAPQNPSFNRGLIIHHLILSIMMLFFHVLMLSLLSGGSAKVVKDFKSECDDFFANKKSPTGFSGKQYEKICQNLNNVVYYATLYDTVSKIPVYSAYKFEGLKNCTRLNKWYIEPQLDDINQSPNMKFEKHVKIQGLGNRQALNRDYMKSDHDKGHLEPVFQANSQGCANATFTLTNAAPQNPSFNRGVVPAYKFEGIKNCTRLNKWYIEPQLDDNNGSPSMKFEKDVNIKTLGDHQALNKDYKKSDRDKGHLEPVFQASSQGCADATFTLTNAAPQNPSFNRDNLIIYQLTMMLLLHVLMLSLLSGGSAEVVLHFKDVCDQFFANGKPPTGFSGVQYRKICQKQDNVYYFATFYDTSNRIPVYSAYVFQGIMGCKRLKNEKFWFIEPQLDDNNTSPNMQLNKDVSIQGLGNHQALNKDYVNSKYDRGHLAPVYQANSQSCAYATFTLTNGAPQNPSFNRVQWNTLEENLIIHHLILYIMMLLLHVLMLSLLSGGSARVVRDFES
ncbi:endonuclease domain-containing 1 -like protein [Labeo rohita]|uniref:Endonuclease domain-containing 1-like protein n=1 Tax=Labeo rohita TaxID=84645 RepID=A0A498N8L9_LABRO|nr:endonuclease domain-containing 1 -like protein [Labeo rohita]